MKFYVLQAITDDGRVVVECTDNNLAYVLPALLARANGGMVEVRAIETPGYQRTIFDEGIADVETL